MKGLCWGKHPLGKAVTLTYTCIYYQCCLKRKGKGGIIYYISTYTLPVSSTDVPRSWFSEKRWGWRVNLVRNPKLSAPMCRALSDTEQTWKGLLPGFWLDFIWLHTGKCVKPSKSVCLFSVQSCQQPLIMPTILCDCILCIALYRSYVNYISLFTTKAF